MGNPAGLALGLLGILVSWWSPWLSVHFVDPSGPHPGGLGRVGVSKAGGSAGMRIARTGPNG